MMNSSDNALSEIITKTTVINEFVLEGLGYVFFVFFRLSRAKLLEVEMFIGTRIGKPHTSKPRNMKKLCLTANAIHITLNNSFLEFSCQKIPVFKFHIFRVKSL